MRCEVQQLLKACKEQSHQTEVDLRSDRPVQGMLDRPLQPAHDAVYFVAWAGLRVSDLIWICREVIEPGKWETCG